MTRRNLLVGSLGTALTAASVKMALDGIGNLPDMASKSRRTIPESGRGNDSARDVKHDISLTRSDPYPFTTAYIQELRDIPAGSFSYGFHNGQSEAAPVVDVSAFRMGATPVTWAMWKEYCRAESVTLPEGIQRIDSYPVNGISYNDIVGSNGGGGFCGWASRVTGTTLQLPTGIQFEYAARGGKDRLDYPWGNEFDSSLVSDGVGLAAVDRSDHVYRNAYGLSDMVGNVYQWCSNDYSSGKEIRGGGGAEPEEYRSAERISDLPQNKLVLYGFRLVAPA